jgi:hypothetical protein
VTLADVRDAALILLALESIALGGVAAYLALRLLAFLDLAQEHLEQIAKTAETALESARDAATAANEAATQVRGSTSFLTDQAVLPVIRGASALSGAAGFARSLLGSGRTRRRRVNRG